MGPKIYTFDRCWQLASLPKDFKFSPQSTVNIINLYYYFALFFVKGIMSLSQFVFPQSPVRLGIPWIVKSFVSSGICLVLSVQFPFRCIVFFLIIFLPLCCQFPVDFMKSNLLTCWHLNFISCFGRTPIPRLCKYIYVFSSRILIFNLDLYLEFIFLFSSIRLSMVLSFIEVTFINACFSKEMMLMLLFYFQFYVIWS